MRDWGGYAAIVEEAREIKRNEKPSEACPLCGELLEFNERRGLANCPLGHYRVVQRRQP